MERLVGAKRSSRLADKQDRERRDAEQAEGEKKRRADLAAARFEKDKQEKMEQDRQYRMMTREQRIKDREYKRILKEEELARDELEQKRIEQGQARGSDRALKQRMERNKKELEDLDAEEDWTFDCSGCGVYGKNLVSGPSCCHHTWRLTSVQDDGTHIISCERCNVWQHSKCLGISKAAAEKEDFHFVCKDCIQKEEDSKKPKISLKFRVGASSSPAPPSPAPFQSTFGVDAVTGRPTSQVTFANGHQYSSGQSARPSQPSLINGTQHGSPQRLHLGSAASRPLQSGYQAIQPYPPSVNNGQASSPAPARGSPPYYNGVPHQGQTYPPGQRPLAPSPIPKIATPASTPLSNGGRLPSPLLNRPTMSPTQGNMDVGLIASIPQRPLQSPQRAPDGVPSPANGPLSHLQATPTPIPQSQFQNVRQTPISRTPNYPLSGLSPKKQQTPGPLPPPGVIPQKSTSMSPPPTSFSSTQQLNPSMTTASSVPHAGETRNISGTPIMPPVEKLQPSPQQLRNSSSNGPVPTPSKQPPPQVQAGNKLNELLFATNAPPGGSEEEPDAFSGTAIVEKSYGVADSALQKELGQRSEEVRKVEHASHPGMKDVAMQDM